VTASSAGVEFHVHIKSVSRDSKLLLTKITVLSDLSELNVQQGVNFKGPYLAQKRLKLQFEIFMTF